MLNGRRIGRRPGHFLAQLRFKAGVFGLECMDVSRGSCSHL
jgi:hypothetical protein